MKPIYRVLALGTVLVSSCTVRGRGAAHVHAEPVPVGTVTVTSAPVVNYEAYPHAYYDGRTVYYVDGRWGYPNAGGWVYYQQEPPPLVRHRTTIQNAPPAPRRYPPQSVPPATRTR